MNQLRVCITFLLSLLPTPSVITEHELPVLYVSFLLAGHLMMVVYICQSPPPHSSRPPIPLCPHVHSLSLCLYSCPANRLICTIFLDSIHLHNVQYLFFFFWLTSLNMIDYRFIHVTTNDPISFLLMTNTPLYVYITSSLCIHADGQSGYFHVLAVVNSASLNFGVHASFWITVFSRYMPSNGIAGLRASFFFRFLRESCCTVETTYLDMSHQWPSTLADNL